MTLPGRHVRPGIPSGQINTLAGMVTAAIAWWSVWSGREDQNWQRSQDLGK